MATEIAKAYVQIIPSAQGIGGELSKTLGGEAADAGKTSGSKFTAGFKSAIGGAAKVAAGALVASTAAVGAFAKSAVDAGSQFDSSMSQVAATMGVTVDEIGVLRDFAQEMGSKTAFSATEAADALNYMALAGYDAETSMQMLPNVLNLAAAGGMELASASDMITDSQSALGLTLEETSSLVDKMASASSKSNTSVSQLGEAILKIGGTAKTLSGGTTELATALGILADNGTKGAEGGTALRNIMLSLQAPTDKAAKALDELGIDAYDAEGNMRPLSEIFSDFNTALDGATDEKRANVLNNIFNKVDLKNVNALMNTNAERWEELAAAIDDSQGASQKMADTQLDNLTGDITLFQSALEGVKIAVSDGLTPSLREFVQFGTDGLSRITEAFNEGGLSGALGELGTVLSEGISMIAEKAPEMINAGMELLQALGDGLLNNIGVITDAAFQIVQSLVEKILSPGTLSSMLQAGLDIISQLGTGIADALPTLIPMAVEVIVELVQTLIENIPMLIDCAVQIITGLADGIMQALPILIQALPQIITSLIDAMIQALPTLIDGVIQLVMMIVQNLPTIIQALVDATPEIIVAIVDGLIEGTPMLIAGFIQLFIALAGAMPQIMQALIQAIPQIITAIIEAFADLGPQLMQELEIAFMDIGSAFMQLGTFAEESWNDIKTAFAPADKWFSNTFKTAYNGIKKAFDSIDSFFSGIWNDIQDVFSNAGEKFMEVGKNIVEGIKQGIAGTWENLKKFLQGVCGDLVALAKKILGIGSPSKEFADQVGQWIPAGIAQGIKNNLGVLDSAINDMTGEALQTSVSGTVETVNSMTYEPMSPVTSTGETVVINNNIKVDGAQDPEAWTQTFIRTLKREARMA